MTVKKNSYVYIINVLDRFSKKLMCNTIGFGKTPHEALGNLVDTFPKELYDYKWKILHANEKLVFSDYNLLEEDIYGRDK